MKYRKHIEYDVEFDFEERADGSLIAPKCEECDASVDRPKCAWELGGACPRHEAQDAFNAARRTNLQLLGHCVVGSSSSESPLVWRCISKDCYSYPCAQSGWMLSELADPKTSQERRDQIEEVWNILQLKFHVDHPSKVYP